MGYIQDPPPCLQVEPNWGLTEIPLDRGLKCKWSLSWARLKPLAIPTRPEVEPGTHLAGP